MKRLVHVVKSMSLIKKAKWVQSIPIQTHQTIDQIQIACGPLKLRKISQFWLGLENFMWKEKMCVALIMLWSTLEILSI